MSYVVKCCLDPGQKIIFSLYWSLADETSDISPDEKVKGI
jgi:hypothetical protein